MRLCQCPSLPIIASLKDEASNGSPHSFAIVNELHQDVAVPGDGFAGRCVRSGPPTLSTLMMTARRWITRRKFRSLNSSKNCDPSRRIPHRRCGRSPARASTVHRIVRGRSRRVDLSSRYTRARCYGVEREGDQRPVGSAGFLRMFKCPFQQFVSDAAALMIRRHEKLPKKPQVAAHPAPCESEDFVGLFRYPQPASIIL